MRFAPGVLVLVLALPAVSEAQSTRCTTLGNVTNCETSAGLSGGLQAPVDYGAMMRNPDGSDPFDYGAAMKKGYREATERQAAEDRVKLARAVGTAIVAHDCEGAAAIALKAGEFSLAERAKAICTPKP